MRRRPYALIVPAAVALLALSGCTPGATDPTSTNIPGQTETPRATSTSTATPTPTASKLPSTPIAITCLQLVTLEDLYAFNPNYGTAPDYAPKAGSPLHAVVDEKGIACGWLNQSSGDIIEMGVAQPAPSELASLRAQAASSMTAVPTYGTPPIVDGFFVETNGTGTVQVFTDRYWLVGSSPAFFEPGDAAQLVQTALSHLP